MDPLPLDRWADGNFGDMPLPGLLATPAQFRARFELSGRVASSELLPERRVACLERKGIVLLQQRHVYSLTRVVVDLPTLYEQSAPVLDEADLMEEWLSELVPLVDDRPDMDALAREETAFDDCMRDSVTGPSLRIMLNEPAMRATVRRRVLQAIRDRRSR